MNLQRYLKMMDEMKRGCMSEEQLARFTTPEAYVLRYGKAYESQDLTAAEHEAVIDLACSHRRFPLKECFSNSQQVILDGGAFQYVEGYCLRLDLPIATHHAWLTLNGKVVDVTMRKKGRFAPRRDRSLSDRVAIGRFFEPMEYLGVEFSMEEIRSFVLETETWGSLIDDWTRGYPLLKKTEAS